MKSRVLLSLFLGVFLTLNDSWARWAAPEDALAEYLFYDRNVSVKKDGTYQETITFQVRILKEGGRAGFSVQPFVYSARNSTLKILEAKTIHHEKSFSVDLSKIEDKPIASSTGGFDENRQILIAFPQVEIGSEVYLKYQRNVHTPLLSGLYADDFVFGTPYLFHKCHAEILSEVSLTVGVSDPEGVVEVQQKQEKSQYHYSFDLKRPYIKASVDEQNVFVSFKKLGWVTATSAKSWNEIANKMGPKYEKVLSEPLPDLFKKIQQEAQHEATSIDQINRVTSRLAEAVNYMGDWRTVDGAYVPRKLSVIAGTKIGDCKDFSASTVAILRGLGFKAYVAIVNRGEASDDGPTDVPYLNFNHAIVRAEKGSKVFWVDPTNFASFAQGIFPDIMGKRALILDSIEASGDALLQTIPIPVASSSGWNLEKQIQLLRRDLLQVNGKIEFFGVTGLGLTGAGLKASKTTIDWEVMKALVDENHLVSWKIGNYDLSSRVVASSTIQFEYLEKNSVIKTSYGRALVFTSTDYLSKFLHPNIGRVTDVWIGAPFVLKRKLHLKGSKSVNSKMLNCQVRSRWADAGRSFKNTAQGVDVEETLETKTTKIPVEDLASKDFAKFQGDLENCFSGVGLVF